MVTRATISPPMERKDPGGEPPRSGLLGALCLLRLGGRSLGGLRDQLPVDLVDGRVVLGKLTGNDGTHAICTALGAHGQSIEPARLGAGVEDANRVKKGGEGVGSRQHQNLDRRAAGSQRLAMGEP